MLLLWRSWAAGARIAKSFVASTAKCISTMQPAHREQKKINNVVIVGGGMMGAGIAEVAAQSGFQVTVVDTDEYTQKCMVAITKSLNRSSKKRFPDEPKIARNYIDTVLKSIKISHHVSEGCSDADLVIECVIEDFDIKKQMLNKIELATPRNTVISTNTSSLSIQDLAEGLIYPERFGALHFFNPVWKMRLVEVGRSTSTSKKTITTLMKFAKDLGKTPVQCQDTHGYIVNRLIMPYLMEALRLREGGVASSEDIDMAMKLGAGFPMGPFELMDHIGLDELKLIIDGWHKQQPENPLYKPSTTLNQLVAKKKLGRKTQHGFYEYEHIMYDP